MCNKKKSSMFRNMTDLWYYKGESSNIFRYFLDLFYFADLPTFLSCSNNVLKSFSAFRMKTWLKNLYYNTQARLFQFDPSLIRTAFWVMKLIPNLETDIIWQWIRLRCGFRFIGRRSAMFWSRTRASISMVFSINCTCIRTGLLRYSIVYF